MRRETTDRVDALDNGQVDARIQLFALSPDIGGVALGQFNLNFLNPRVEYEDVGKGVEREIGLKFFGIQNSITFVDELSPIRRRVAPPAQGFLQRVKRPLHGVANLVGIIAQPVELEFKSPAAMFLVTQRSFDADLPGEQVRR